MPEEHARERQDGKHDDGDRELDDDLDGDGSHTEGDQVVGRAAADVRDNLLVRMAVELERTEDCLHEDAADDGDAVGGKRHLREHRLEAGVNHVGHARGQEHERRVPGQRVHRDGVDGVAAHGLAGVDRVQARAHLFGKLLDLLQDAGLAVADADVEHEHAQDDAAQKADGGEGLADARRVLPAPLGEDAAHCGRRAVPASEACRDHKAERVVDAREHDGQDKGAQHHKEAELGDLGRAVDKERVARAVDHSFERYLAAIA